MSAAGQAALRRGAQLGRQGVLLQLLAVLGALGALQLPFGRLQACVLGGALLTAALGRRRWGSGQRWRAGGRGERDVARRLRRLERRGWLVVHDLDCHRGNVDHLAAGPGGVFTVETKLRRAGAGELAQARAHAAWAARRLGRPVRPVLCLARRAQRPRERDGVLVVDARRLTRTLRRGRGPAADLEAVAARLRAR